MPIPIILAVAAGVAGLGGGIRGGVKMKEAKDTMDIAQNVQKKAVEKFEKKQKESTEIMDKLGKTELEIISSFSKFSECFEKIKNRPVFKEQNIDGVDIPQYDPEEIKNVSVGAGVLLGGLGGAALGTAGGFAAAGATTAAVMAFGTASTGTAISTLSGVAATNATLAAIGGGSIAAGGGGVAAGTAILGAATLGVGLLVGGVIFNFTGGHLSNKADEAYSQAKKTEKESNNICNYLDSLMEYANIYQKTLDNVNGVYKKELNTFDSMVNYFKKLDYNDYTTEEKKLVENLVLLVGLLNKMCKVKLVIQSEKEEEINKVNKLEVSNSVNDANKILQNCNDFNGELVNCDNLSLSKCFDKNINFNVYIKDFNDSLKSAVSDMLQSLKKAFIDYADNHNVSSSSFEEACKILSKHLNNNSIQRMLFDDSEIEPFIKKCFDNDFGFFD